MSPAKSKTRMIRMSLLLALAMAGAVASSVMADDAEEEALHEQIINACGGELPSTEAQVYVHQVAKGLIQAAKMDDLSLYVINSPDLIQFTTASHVYLTRGLLEHLDNEAQLAAAIALEMAHIKLNHVQARADAAKSAAMKRNIGQAIAGFARGGRNINIDPNAFRGGNQAQAGVRFTEQEESEAAQEALKMLAAAGYEPDQFHLYADTMLHASQPRIKGAINTHALSYTLIAEIEKMGAATFPTRDPKWKIGARLYRENVLDPVRALPPVDPQELYRRQQLLRMQQQGSGNPQDQSAR